MGKLKRFNPYQYTLEQRIVSSKRETKHYKKHFIHSDDVLYAVIKQLDKSLNRFLPQSDLAELRMSVIGKIPKRYRHGDVSVSINVFTIKQPTKHEKYMHINMRYKVRDERFYHTFRILPYAPPTA